MSVHYKPCCECNDSRSVRYVVSVAARTLGLPDSERVNVRGEGRVYCGPCLEATDSVKVPKSLLKRLAVRARQVGGKGA